MVAFDIVHNETCVVDVEIVENLSPKPLPCLGIKAEYKYKSYMRKIPPGATAPQPTEAPQPISRPGISKTHLTGRGILLSLLV